MTEKELDLMIEENDGELDFDDGYALTDYSAGRYCMYAPDQGFGAGTVCGFEEAVKFYNDHKGECNMLNISTQFYGGRGSGGGKGSGGNKAPKLSGEQTHLMNMLSSAAIDTVYRSDGVPTWESILNPAWVGDAKLKTLLGSNRTFKEFESVTGLSKKELESAVQQIHPNKEVKLVRTTRKGDKYARGGGSPAKTIYSILVSGK